MLSKLEILMVQYLALGTKTKVASIVHNTLKSENDGFLDIVKQKISPDITSNKVDEAFKVAKEIERKSLQQQIHILDPSSPFFPSELKEISSPPTLLFVKGNISLLAHKPSIAIVGTRNPSSYGTTMGRMIADTLARKDFSIVSGLALGCDTAAHLGALDANGKTIAILAHGLDTVYPPQNITLARKIVESGGCLVSEYAPGVSPMKHHFIARNRLQCGISQGVIVVECGEKSGTMHTANFCIQQRKPLACHLPPKNIDGIIDLSGNRLLASKGVFIFKTMDELALFVSKIVPPIKNNNKAESGGTGRESLISFKGYGYTEPHQNKTDVKFNSEQNNTNSIRFKH